MAECKVKQCFKCNKEIHELHTPSTGKQFPDEMLMWNGGIVDKISANYGSEFDSNMYIIAICDECIKTHKDLLTYVGNYMDDHFNNS